MRSRITQTAQPDLLVGYLPLVKAAAARVRRHIPRQSDFDDLVAAGVFALHDAANQCSPNQPVPFTVLAKQRIRGAILDRLKKQYSPKRRLRSPQPRPAAQEPARTHGSTPQAANRDDEFGTALTCLQRALAAGDRSGLTATEESATDRETTRRRDGGG